jgi:hypothetical protein
MAKHFTWDDETHLEVEDTEYHLRLARELLGHEIGFCKCFQCLHTAAYLDEFEDNIIAELNRMAVKA